MRVAAIDLGTNSFHLEIAEVAPDGRLSIVEKAREQVELGAGGIGAHRIAPEAYARGLNAMIAFKQACDSLGVEDVAAAATSAVREAENGHEFCRDVRAKTGIHVRVITGMDEAKLIYLGVRADLDFSAGRALLFDLGGGSTEFVLCDAEQPLVLESLPLGHIRLTEAFVKSDPIAESERQALKLYVRKLLQPLLARVRPGDFASLVGTSGTVRALAHVATRMRGDPEPEHRHGLVLRRAELEEIIKVLRTKPSSQWDKALPGMDLRRRRTITAGAVLVREVMKAFNKDVALTSERSLRDGLVAGWVLEHRPEIRLSGSVPDPRRRSVLSAMERFGADVGHSRHVADLGLALFDGTTSLHKLGVDDRRMLEFAALLHDIGHHISGKDHNRHGQYLIRHTRMPGFTAPEIAILASVVRYHRGAKPKARHLELAAMTPRDQHRVRVLAALVRLADALDRGHDGNVESVQVSQEGGGVVVRATTRHGGDLEQWTAVRRSDALADALGAGVRVDVVPRATDAGVL